MIGRFTLLAAFAAIVLSQPAAAQDARAAARQACTPDYKRFCSGVTPGGGRVLKCLTEHLDKLSPACRGAVQANTTAKAKG